MDPTGSEDVMTGNGEIATWTWNPEILKVTLMAAVRTCRDDRGAMGRYYRWPNLQILVRFNIYY